MGHLLAADVGGTKTIVALADASKPWPAIIARERYSSRDFSTLESLLEHFLVRNEMAPPVRTIAAACFSVAGPVIGNATTLTNLRWRIEADRIADRLAVPRVKLINDFGAAGLGITCLAPDDLAALQHGSPRERGVRVVIGAGTGLGVGWLTWHEDRYVSHPSEAGHSDFAPRDELQDELLAYLRRSFEHVSAERVISGPGLARIFEFLRESKREVPAPELLEAIRSGEDEAEPELISDFAIAGRDAAAVRALDIFACAYGAFAGDMALATLAHGGVYIAGGIAPKILAKLEDGTFLRAFLDKGRYRELLQTMPVHVVLNPEVGLYGALSEAARL
jgi:glucokinase